MWNMAFYEGLCIFLLLHILYIILELPNKILRASQKLTDHMYVYILKCNVQSLFVIWFFLAELEGNDVKIK
jgi:uncharacterized membrane protein YhhN